MSLLSVEDAQKSLKNSFAEGDDLTELAVYVAAVCGYIDEMCGPSVHTMFTQTFVGWSTHSGVLFLDEPRVISVTSIVGPAGLIDPTLYVLDPAAGTVRLLSGVSSSGTYTVSYTAGRMTVPPPLALAARVLLKAMWADRRGSGSREVGGLDAGGIGVSNGMVGALGIVPPKRALMMMGPYLKDQAGFA